MKLKTNLPKFQEGGVAPSPTDGQMAPANPAAQGAPQGTPAEQDPLMQISQIAAEALQTQNCEAAFAVCEAFLQLVSQASSQAAPESPQEPTFQKEGGKLTRKG